MLSKSVSWSAFRIMTKILGHASLLIGIIVLEKYASLLLTQITDHLIEPSVEKGFNWTIERIGWNDQDSRSE